MCAYVYSPMEMGCEASLAEMSTYNTLRILRGFIHAYYYVYYVLSFLRKIYVFIYEVKYVFQVIYSHDIQNTLCKKLRA